MASAAGRRLALRAGLVLLCGACGEGTAGWVLSTNRTAASGPDAGEMPAAGAAGSAGSGGQAARNPDDFGAVCSPIVSVDNRTAARNGQLFAEAFPAPSEFVVQTARSACALLYKQPSEVPITTDVALIVEDFDGIGEIGAAGASVTLRLSSLYMQSVASAGGNVHDEIAGVTHYLIGVDYTLDDENPAAVAWLAQGLGDWVRFRAGYTPLERRTPGGTWTDGFTTTAFFLDWLDTHYVDAAYRLNQSMNGADAVSWSDQIFVEVAGKGVSELWTDYQASL